MWYTYILKDDKIDNFYIGYTEDLKKRLREHKAGQTRSTQGRTWKLHAYFAFSKEQTARHFETYLKSGSGRAFCMKHFE